VKKVFRIQCSVFGVLVAGALAMGVAGCVSKSKARAQARDAFIAGQQESLRMMQLNQSPNINFIGPVKNSMVLWTNDLTLAQALVSAEYAMHGDPREIILIRKGVASRIDPKKLLAGEDVPLQPGDVIQVNP
jgi:hypothetical protein